MKGVGEGMNEQLYDVIILGTGPAGLQAAIHASRRKVSVLVLGKLRKSSAFGAHVENYCCIDGDTGADLLKGGYEKARQAGVEFREEDVTALTEKEGSFTVSLESGRTVTGRAVILAMGISRKKLELKGEKEFIGRGVSYCADCDAGFYRDQTVAVIGCESAAVSSALTMLFYARQVHLVCEELDVADELAEKMKQSEIVLHEGRRVTEIIAGQAVEGIVLDDGSRIELTGIFIVLGAKGAVDLAAGLGVALDTETMKYIATNKKQETNLPGIYAAGDICGPPWQVAKAVGEGCVAGLEAAAYAKKKKALDEAPS
jgi:thioredoxin reductase (NADPH)